MSKANWNTEFYCLKSDVEQVDIMRDILEVIKDYYKDKSITELHIKIECK